MKDGSSYRSYPPSLVNPPLRGRDPKPDAPRPVVAKPCVVVTKTPVNPIKASSADRRVGCPVDWYTRTYYALEKTVKRLNPGELPARYSVHEENVLYWVQAFITNCGGYERVKYSVRKPNGDYLVTDLPPQDPRDREGPTDEPTDEGSNDEKGSGSGSSGERPRPYSGITSVRVLESQNWKSQEERDAAIDAARQSAEVVVVLPQGQNPSEFYSSTTGSFAYGDVPGTSYMRYYVKPELIEEFLTTYQMFILP